VPRSGRANRERILQIAEKLMIEQGYNATPLEQIIAAAGTSKGAFFHHFQSKMGLVQQLVERYVASDLAHLHAGLAAIADVDEPSARVVAFLQFFEDGADELMSEQSGCLYATVLAEREFTGSEVNALVAQAALAWRCAFVKLLGQALQVHRPVLAIDVVALADHLFTTFEGAFILCRTHGEPSAMRAQLRVFRQLVEAFFRVP
jgi:TetR/AcrR family transcriptional repressor of nem operon